MPLQDNIGHFQAEAVLIREGTPSRTLSQCPLQWLRPRGGFSRRFAPLSLAGSSNRRTGSFSSFHPAFEPRLSASARTSALARALRKILAKADLAGLNTVEIASITAQELLGIQFACIEARLRHIQQGLVLTPEKQGTKPSGTTGLRPPSPQAVRGDRFVPRLANALRACLPHVRRNFNS